MKRKIKLTCFIVFAVIISLISSMNTAKAMDLSVTASSSTVTPGEKVTITVTPDSKLSGIDLEITYDSSLFTYVSGTTSSSTVGNFSDNNGKVSYIDSSTSNSEIKTISFTFTASDNVGKTGKFQITSTAITADDGSKYAGGDEYNGNNEVTEISTDNKYAEVTIVSATSDSGDDGSGGTDSGDSGSSTTDKSGSPVIAPTKLEMVVGDTDEVTADEDVTWKSGNDSVVTVDPETGKVTAVGEGTTTITATDANGNTSSITVTVKPEKPVITPSSLDMVVGDTDKVTADRDVTWKSGDESIVTVDPETGKVTAVGKGTTTITATDANGKTSSITVTVTSEAPVLSPDSASMSKGDTLQITSNKDIVSWTSSDTSVATVDKNGLVTAVGVGTVTITATDADGNTSTITITVADASSTTSNSSIPKTGESTYTLVAIIAVLALAVIAIRKKFNKINFKEEKNDIDR